MAFVLGSSSTIFLKSVFVVQLLWVNLIMDTLGALALATEPPTDHLMHRSPVGRREPLVTNNMWRNLIIQALYQVAVLLVLNFRGTAILNLKKDERGNAVMIIQFLGKFTSTVRLGWNLWVVSIVIGIFSWPLAMMGKLIPVPRTPLARVFSKPYQRCIASRNHR
ncbi:hypothetical protein E3N88_45998 [Mikania micrantha]|uniref:Cation-transporting P-type ATPase C-terminal domain-containing protein n=1 Tax=Mikania micrantha TaxID=192012 RepID=A0A5N6L7U3_9ASTR|nr:hypothetical protein E3N88_45998 [Mikania micrantha]